MIKVSIIIPVFNADKHLEKCIKSLLSQTFMSCEFIFINDGSTDTSKEIIESFQKNDSRIILLNQENKGVSQARNNGLSLAKGIYIGFVDADDYVENDYFETLYKTIENTLSDIVICKYFSSQEGHSFISNHPVQEKFNFEKKDIQHFLIPHLISNENLNSIWNKLYKKKLLTDNKILFPVGISLGEDGLFNLSCFFYAKKIRFINYVGYHYLEVAGSATKNFLSKNYFQQIVQEYYNDYSKFSTDDLASEKINFLKAQKFINKIISLLHEYHNKENKLSHIQKKRFINEILNNNTTKKIIQDYYKIVYLQKSKYEKTLLFALKYRIPFIISMSIKYSQFRNKK